MADNGNDNGAGRGHDDGQRAPLPEDARRVLELARGRWERSLPDKVLRRLRFPDRRDRRSDVVFVARSRRTAGDDAEAVAQMIGLFPLGQAFRDEDTLRGIIDEAFGTAEAPDDRVKGGNGADWRASLILNERRRPRPVLANAITALTHHPAWRDVLGFDQLAQAVVMTAPAPWLTGAGEFTPREWGDLDDICASEWLQRHSIMVSPLIAGQAVRRVAADRPYHPIRTWLSGLKWNGRGRLDTWLSVYLGAPDTPYTRAIGAKWMISAIARINRPGAKVDSVLILESPQGEGKSTALATLTGAAWFSDQLPDFGNKDSMLQLQGVWVVELAELDSLNRAEISRVKAFLSTQRDRFRAPYDRRPAWHPRQCVFGGTVNPGGTGYLRDPTGGRRFWPVTCGTIDLAALARDREQLWAEASARFTGGESWWMDTRELADAAREEQEARFEGDAWEDIITAFVASLEVTTIATVLESAVRLDRGR